VIEIDVFPGVGHRRRRQVFGPFGERLHISHKLGKALVLGWVNAVRIADKLSKIVVQREAVRGGLRNNGLKKLGRDLFFLNFHPPYDSTEFRMRPQKAGKEHSVLVGVRAQREIAFEVRQLQCLEDVLTVFVRFDRDAIDIDPGRGGVTMPERVLGLAEGPRALGHHPRESVARLVKMNLAVNRHIVC
jgi:hypothetical protein